MTESTSSSTSERDLPIGTLEEWHATALPLLDLRSFQDAQKHPVPGSISIPLAEIKQRSYELPPRQDAFAVLVPSSDNDKDEALTLIREFFLCQEVNGKKRRRAQKPWKVPLVIVANNEWQMLLDKSTTTSAEDDTKFRPLPRLWKPDSMVQEVLLPLLKEHLEKPNTTADAATTTVTTHQIWDLGAGAGRDVCFLAEELKAATCSSNNNFCVVAMDQRYRNLKSGGEQEECLFFQRRHVGGVTKCVAIQWSSSNDDNKHKEWFQQQQQQQEQQTGTGSNSRVLCLYMVRFWNKSLMEFLAESKLLEKGTLVAVSQFTKAAAGASWDFEHPKEKHVLERDELSKMFCTEAGWHILHDNIVKDSDHGRTLVNFVAAKR